MADILGPYQGWYWKTKHVWYWRVKKAEQDGWKILVHGAYAFRPLMIKKHQPVNGDY